MPAEHSDLTTATESAPGDAAQPALHLFGAVGVEVQYALVTGNGLRALPAVDELLLRASATRGGEVDLGQVAASHQLALHVVELKATEPASSFDGLARRLQSGAQRLNQAAASMGARLLPTGMHPLFDPLAETRLWRHDGAEVYAELDRLYDCWQHGWSNAQSTSLNLPFCGDDEFGRLHAAIRMVLPILPALAASSPIVEGFRTGMLDTRLRHYRENAPRVPGVTGPMVPEPVFTEDEYQTVVLEPIRHELRRQGAAAVLDAERVNARAAIARFTHGRVELRLLDAQEFPAADVAICAAAAACIRAFIEERWCSFDDQRRWRTEALDHILKLTSAVGGDGLIWDEDYLRAFGLQAGSRCTARQLWDKLLGELFEAPDPVRQTLEVVLHEGCLARRILRAVGTEMSRQRVAVVYTGLADCLAEGRPFHAAPDRQDLLAADSQPPPSWVGERRRVA